jgi:hypothetical protein
VSSKLAWATHQAPLSKNQKQIKKFTRHTQRQKMQFEGHQVLELDSDITEMFNLSDRNL